MTAYMESVDSIARAYADTKAPGRGGYWWSCWARVFYNLIVEP